VREIERGNERMRDRATEKEGQLDGETGKEGETDRERRNKES